MGAQQFITTGSGDDVKHAFENACSEAAYEHGHGGYTGSIAEKDSFVEIDPQIMFPDLASAEARAEDLMDADDPRIRDKWGPAGALHYRNPNTDSPEKTWLFFGWASS